MPLWEKQQGLRASVFVSLTKNLGIKLMRELYIINAHFRKADSGQRNWSKRHPGMGSFYATTGHGHSLLMLVRRAEGHCTFLRFRVTEPKLKAVAV